MFSSQSSAANPHDKRSSVTLETDLRLETPHPNIHRNIDLTAAANPDFRDITVNNTGARYEANLVLTVILYLHTCRLIN